jgi:Inner membrane protein YgaP-like, transmembrane domain
MGFAKFMASTAGRVIRIIAGIALILVGLLVVHGIAGVVLAVIGLVPLLAPLFDVCIFAPLFRGPFQGAEARKLS